MVSLMIAKKYLFSIILILINQRMEFFLFKRELSKPKIFIDSPKVKHINIAEETRCKKKKNNLHLDKLEKYRLCIKRY